MKNASLIVLFFCAVTASTAEAVIGIRAADPVLSATTIHVDATDAGAITKCSAVIVNSHLILTAGHCFDSGTKTLAKSFDMGVTNLPYVRRASLVRVVKWNRPAAYIEFGTKTVADTKHDLAYLVTKEDLLNLFNLRPERLPKVVAPDEALSDILASNELIFYGYGLFNFSQAGYKSELAQKIVPSSAQSLKVISLEEGRGVCEGDSGGNLSTRPTATDSARLIGILSAMPSENCGSPGQNGWFVNIAQHACWIQKDSGVSLGLNCD